MACRSCRPVGGFILKVHVTTAAAVIAVAILAVLVGNAVAQDTPPTVTEAAPSVSQPVGSGDIPIDPDAQVPPSHTAAAVPPVTPVQTLLLKQVAQQITLYHRDIVRLERQLGLRLLPLSPVHGAVTSLSAGNQLLGKLKAQSRTLHLQWLRRRISDTLQSVQHMRLVMGLKPIVRTLASDAAIQQQLLRARRLKAETYRQYSNPPHLAAFMCIHHYEGSWTDTGAPFWGGLQMNYGFMATYGPWLLRHKGTADHWTPMEQIWTAEKAVPSRGFYPWPNTARFCGLI